MSLSSTTNRVSYTGNGAVDTYAYTFKIFDDDDLTVTVRSTADVETTLVKTTDYTVSGVGASSGGNVALVNSAQAWLDGDGDLKSGYILTIRRVLDIKQETDIRNQGAYYGEIHENQFDKSIMIAQQQQDEIDRSVKTPETISAAQFDMTLPADLLDSADKVPLVNATGDGWADVADWPSAGEIAGAQASAIAAAASEAAALAAKVAAELAETNAETAETNAEIAEANAEIAEANAAASALAAAAAAAAASDAATGLSVYADDAAYVLANGAASEGNFYYASGTDRFRVYINSSWNSVTISELANTITGNNTLSGTNTFSGAQVFTGLHRLSVTTEASNLGAIGSYSNVTPVTEFTGTITSIAGFSNVASGSTIMVCNRTGASFSILDEDTGTTAAQRIRTGTGALITLANNSSILLTYMGDSRWHVIGGSGSGTSSGTNFITNGTAEADTTGWATYADAAGTSPVDGTGGSPTVTLTRSTSSPMVGTASFVFTKDAANRQGEGASFSFSIDSAFKAKVLQIQFEYMVGSGTFAAGSSSADSDITVWVYDVTNSVLIQPSTFRLFSNSATLASTFVSNFQTASNSTSYRLILHCGSTSASAYTLKIDNVVVAPSQYVYGTPITDFQTYTPTFVGFGTVTSPSMWWRRVGDSIEVYGKFTAGTVTATAASFTLPNSAVIDSLKVAAIRSSGSYTTNNSARTTHGGFTLITGGTSVVNFGSLSTFSGSSVTNNVAAVNGDTVAVSGDVIYVEGVSAPITGWSSSVQTSDQGDSRVVSARAYKVTGNHATSGSTLEVASWSSEDHDTHSAFDLTTGRFTAPVSGYYRVSGSVSFAANATSSRVSYIAVNGVLKAVSNVYLSFSDNPVMQVSGVFNLLAGDYVSLFAFQASGGALNYDTTASDVAAGRTQFNVERLSQASLMSATETVAARYSSTAGTSIANTSSTVIAFPTKDFDTHNAYNTSTGLFTCPVAGLYRVTCKAAYASASFPSGTLLNIGLNKNAADTSGIGTVNLMATVTTQMHVAGSDVLRCVAGDTLGIYLYQDTGGARSLSTDARYTHIVFERIGL